MDTSETYVKMRLKAIPDMGMGKPPSLPLGDVAWVDVAVFVDRLGCFYFSSVNLKPLGEEIDCFQLERQDQLQEMTKLEPDDMGYTDTTFWLLHSFWDSVSENKPMHHNGVIRSMEQLWLAFVMKEKYNKVWNGDSWISI